VSRDTLDEFELAASPANESRRDARAILSTDRAHADSPQGLSPQAYLRRGLVFAAVIAVACLAALRGLQLRDQMWERTAAAHYHGDIGQAFSHGNRVMNEARSAAAKRRAATQPNARATSTSVPWRDFFTGYVSVYAKIQQEHPRGDFEMDYPPLRLLVASLWVKHVQAAEPWRMIWMFGSANAAKPMLGFNSVCAGIASVGMFFLVWLCMRREHTANIASFGVPAIETPVSLWQSLKWAAAPAAGALFWTIAARALAREQWPAWYVLTAMFGLFLVVVRSVRSWPTPYRYWGCGLVAALLVWFNAALLIDAHAWPQWDAWLLPAFILAALLATADCWLAAGIFIAIGGMLKGQMFLVAPLFVLWPLFEGRIGAALRWIAGCLLGAAVIVSPWLLAERGARYWLVGVAAASAALGIWFYLRARSTAAPNIDSSNEPQARRKWWPPRLRSFRLQPKWTVYLVLASSISMVFMVIVSRHGQRLERWGTLVLLGILIAGPIALRRGAIGAWACLVLGLAVFLGGNLFNGDWSWYEVGFKYGTQRHADMSLGDNPNLAGILRDNWGFDDIHQKVGPISLPLVNKTVQPEIRTLLSTIYGSALVLCAIACAIQNHRRDVRLLVALAAPWVLFPALMGQMSVRYWLWPATLSSSFVAVSAGASLLYWLLTSAACVVICRRLLEATGGRGAPTVWDFTGRFHADLGWMFLLIAAIFLYLALTPTQDRRILSD
jgi:hypothetical protein